MGWLVAVLFLYALLGRALVRSRFRGRELAFVALNVASVYAFYFRPPFPSYAQVFALLFAGYLGTISLQYLALVRWVGAPGARWLPAFLTPIALLVVIRYAPLTAIARALLPPVDAVLRRHPEITVASVFTGFSYVVFRTSHLALQVRTRVAPRPSYLRYLGYALFLPTFAVGPISPYAMHREAFEGTSAIPPRVSTAALRVLVGAAKLRFLGPLAGSFAYGGLLLDGHPHGSIDLPIAAVAYYVYLYANFSGFCDIAIGGAGLMGIAVAENFKGPFAARNVRDFWNRWHITLSEYMREVVFVPVSKALVRRLGPRRADHAIALSTMLVFLLVGVWHGVGYHYAIFGALHGAGVAANHYYTAFLKARLGKQRFAAYEASRAIRAAATGLTFAYVAATLFFFANDLATIREIFSNLEWR